MQIIRIFKNIQYNIVNIEYFSIYIYIGIIIHSVIKIALGAYIQSY